MSFLTKAQSVLVRTTGRALVDLSRYEVQPKQLSRDSVPTPAPKTFHDNLILQSDLFGRLVSTDPLIYIDAGARGGLGGIWAKLLDGRVRAYSFEPDPDAKMSASTPTHTAFRKALWRDNGGVTLHIAEQAATSSVPPPNSDLLQRFLTHHEAPRRTAHTVEVPSISLDEVTTAAGCANFIKIDTHGSEFDILVGAEATLSDRRCIGVLIETWTTEVHVGQKLSGDVMTMLHKYGFELFDAELAAAWHRRGGNGQGKRQLTGQNLLFFRDPRTFESESNTALVAKIVGLYQLFGFYEHAQEVLVHARVDASDKDALIDLLNLECEISPLGY